MTYITYIILIQKFILQFLASCWLWHERLSDGACLLRNCTVHLWKHTTIIFACSVILLGQRCLYTKAHSAWHLFSVTA